jgi:hypothetical protein
MGLRRIEPPEGEIGKAGVKRSLRMSGKEAPAGALVLDASSLETRGAADEGEARMRERVAAPDARKQERSARIGLQMARMGGKPRQEEQGAPVDIGGDAGEAGKWRALRIERRKRTASHAAQQSLSQGQGVEIRRDAPRALISLFGGAACHSVF